MILAARKENCLREVVIIAAALSAQDPRERPPEQAGAALIRRTRSGKTRSPSSCSGYQALACHRRGLEA